MGKLALLQALWQACSFFFLLFYRDVYTLSKIFLQRTLSNDDLDSRDAYKIFVNLAFQPAFSPDMPSSPLPLPSKETPSTTPCCS